MKSVATDSPFPPDPKPRKSRRMVVWLVAVPIVILLLALAGANWRSFHLAYAKHLIGSDDLDRQYRGVMMVLRTHVREGMTREEVGRLLAPAILYERSHGEGQRGEPYTLCELHSGQESYVFTTLLFDGNERLTGWQFPVYDPSSRK